MSHYGYVFDKLVSQPLIAEKPHGSRRRRRRRAASATTPKPAPRLRAAGEALLTTKPQARPTAQ